MIILLGVLGVFVISWIVRTGGEEVPTVTATSTSVEPTTLLALVVAASSVSSAITDNTAADLVQDLPRESESESESELTQSLLVTTTTTTSKNNNHDDEYNDNDKGYEAKHRTCVAHAEAARGLWHRFCGNPLVLILPQCWTRTPSVNRRQLLHQGK